MQLGLPYFMIYTDTCHDIEKAIEIPTITVNITSASPIMIKLDKKTNKVLVMSTVAGRYKELQYEVLHRDQEIFVVTRMPQESSVMHNVFKVKKLIEQIIYEFVYHLTSEARTKDEYSYYCKILSQDDRFMKVVQEIHENRHKGFEEGYQYLMNHS